MLENISSSYVSQQPIVSDLTKKEIKNEKLVDYSPIISTDEAEVSNADLKYDINAIKDNNKLIYKQPIETKVPESIKKLILKLQIQQLMQKLIEKLQKLMGTNKSSDTKSDSKAPFGVEIKKDPITGRYYATRPETKEFKAHDKYMAEKMAEYDKKHPFKFNPLLLQVNQGFKEAKERQEYMDKLEKEYRESHPEYDVQATYYEAKQEEAQKMNRPSWLTLTPYKRTPILKKNILQDDSSSKVVKLNEYTSNDLEYKAI